MAKEFSSVDDFLKNVKKGDIFLYENLEETKYKFCGIYLDKSKSEISHLFLKGTELYLGLSGVRTIVLADFKVVGPRLQKYKFKIF